MLYERSFGPPPPIRSVSGGVSSEPAEPSTIDDLPFGEPETWAGRTVQPGDLRLFLPGSVTACRALAEVLYLTYDRSPRYQISDENGPLSAEELARIVVELCKKAERVL